MRLARLGGIIAALVVLAGFVQPIEASGRTAVARAAVKGAAQSVRRSLAKVFRLDRLRDLRTPIARLARPRSAFRYVTPPRARIEVRQGLRPGSHLTSRVTRGRPLVASQAQARFGLPPGRTRRLTVDLPAGTRVRFNRALHGQPGIGEITLVDRLPARAVRRVVRLPNK